MTVLDRLACAMARDDEQPNVALAEELAGCGDTAAVLELVAALDTAPKAVRHDAIKVLYEVAARRPGLVDPHTLAFLALLRSRDNRMVWGALTALDQLCATVPEQIANGLAAILAAADAGSVIAKDRAMSILAKLARDQRYTGQVLPILLERLAVAADNQLPMYAEMVAAEIPADRVATLIATLERRAAGLAAPAKRARIAKVIRRVAGGKRQPLSRAAD